MKNLYLVILIFCLFSCIKKEKPRQNFVNGELDKKIKQYEKRKEKRCKKDLMEEITVEVDSIMYFLVAKMNGESEIMPSRPDRPGRLVDTITLETINQN